MTLTIQIDAESYRRHADEQGGTDTSVAAVLRSDMLGAINDALPTLTHDILAEQDAGMTVMVRDGYANYPGSYDYCETRQDANPPRFLHLILSGRN